MRAQDMPDRFLRFCDRLRAVLSTRQRRERGHSQGASRLFEEGFRPGQTGVGERAGDQEGLGGATSAPRNDSSPRRQERRREKIGEGGDQVSAQLSRSSLRDGRTLLREERLEAGRGRSESGVKSGREIS